MSLHCILNDIKNILKSLCFGVLFKFKLRQKKRSQPVCLWTSTQCVGSFFWPFFLLQGMKPIYLSLLWSDSSAGAGKVSVCDEEGKIPHVELITYPSVGLCHLWQLPHKDITSTLNLVNNLVTHWAKKSLQEVISTSSIAHIYHLETLNRAAWQKTSCLHVN